MSTFIFTLVLFLVLLPIKYLDEMANDLNIKNSKIEYLFKETLGNSGKILSIVFIVMSQTCYFIVRILLCKQFISFLLCDTYHCNYTDLFFWGSLICSLLLGFIDKIRFFGYISILVQLIIFLCLSVISFYSF